MYQDVFGVTAVEREMRKEGLVRPGSEPMALVLPVTARAPLPQSTGVPVPVVRVTPGQKPVWGSS